MTATQTLCGNVAASGGLVGLGQPMHVSTQGGRYSHQRTFDLRKVGQIDNCQKLACVRRRDLSATP